MKTWKRRWFILTDSCLYYFEFTTVSLPLPPTPFQTPTKRSTRRAGGLFKITQSTPISQMGKAELHRGGRTVPRAKAELGLKVRSPLIPSQGSSCAAPPTLPGLDRV